jgi:hypothetical protein
MRTGMRAIPTAIDWNPDLPVFASESYLKAMADEYGWLAGIDPNERVRCILPYLMLKKPLLRMVRFPVETIRVDPELSAEEEREFLDSAMQYFRTAGAGVVLPGTTNAIFSTFPQGADAVPYGTYALDLRMTEESLWGGVSSSHRRLIRAAIREHVEISVAPDAVDEAYELIRCTFKRGSIPFMTLAAFRRLIRSLGDSVRLLVARRQGGIQGVIVVPFSRHAAYYLYGGRSGNAVPGAMHLLHWEAIRAFRSDGVSAYDFVGARIDPAKGSKQEGLAAFKQRFGARLTRGYMWRYPLRPFQYWTYSLAARLLRGGDIVQQESTRGAV